MAPTMNDNYRAIVDMGSNGIRFSITDLSPPTARILPTVYQDRLGLSLYNVQYELGSKAAINLDVIEQVIVSLRRFKVTCKDFGVPPDNIRILATEATREATNSLQFRTMIQKATGWEVELLSKEDEGRIGAMGIASSFSSVRGLVMDLGGGSMQLTWMVAEGGRVQMSEKGAISLPYGAAALKKRLRDVKGWGEWVMKQDMQEKLRRAYEELNVPPDLDEQFREELEAKDEPDEPDESDESARPVQPIQDEGSESEEEHDGQLGSSANEKAREERSVESEGFSLYVSGGGFRGWGYLLMSDHRVQPYPVPIINGFRVSWDEFKATDRIQKVAKENDVFRVSEDRANQVPSVACLVNVLAETLPKIKDVYFCQGGVREGKLYTGLPPQIRALHPLVTATLAYAPPMANEIQRILQGALPKGEDHLWCSRIFNTALLRSIANLMYYHRPLLKEIRAAAALRSTTSGFLAGVHGLSHTERALLGLVLCERWRGAMGEIDEEFQSLLQSLVGFEVAWWAKYIGRVSELIGELYPAGNHSDGAPRMTLSSCIKDPPSVYLMVDVSIDPDVHGHALIKGVKRVEKINKKTVWPKGNFYLDVEADIRHSGSSRILEE